MIGLGIRMSIARSDLLPWKALLSSLSLSTGSNGTDTVAALARLGLTLTRGSVATVQTSATSMVVTGITSNVPRVGNAGYGQGLVFEGSRQNDQPDGNANSGWTDNGTTRATATGPDGSSTSACRITDDSAGVTEFVSRSTAYTAGATYVRSVWLKNVSGAGNAGFNSNDGDAAVSLARSSYGSWTRWVGPAYTAGAGPSSNWALIPAYAAAADVGVFDVAFIQREVGRYATEAIVTSGGSATRSAERLQIDRASRAIRNGRLGLTIKLIAKGSIGGSANYSANVRLWTYDASNYVEVNATTGVVTTVIAGASYSTSSGLTCSVGDVVEYRIDAGGSAENTVVKARKNAGATSTLGTSGAPQGTHPNTAGADLLSNSGTSQHFDCWLQEISALRPSWA